MVQLGGAIAQGTLAHRQVLFTEFLDESALIATGVCIVQVFIIHKIYGPVEFIDLECR